MQGNTDLPSGAAIATFDKSGKYFGHGAIYVSQDKQDKNGIKVINEWAPNPQTAQVGYKRKEVFFFEKKKQKTFANSGRGSHGQGRAATNGQKFFAAFFQKKKTSFLLLLEALAPGNRALRPNMGIFRPCRDRRPTVTVS